jgi:hypothetical protein
VCTVRAKIQTQFVWGRPIYACIVGADLSGLVVGRSEPIYACIVGALYWGSVVGRSEPNSHKFVAGVSAARRAFNGRLFNRIQLLRPDVCVDRVRKLSLLVLFIEKKEFPVDWWLIG